MDILSGGNVDHVDHVDAPYEESDTNASDLTKQIDAPYEKAKIKDIGDSNNQSKSNGYVEEEHVQETTKNVEHRRKVSVSNEYEINEYNNSYEVNVRKKETIVSSSKFRKSLTDMKDYKSHAKGLMDVALLSANANQLRNSLSLCSPERGILVTLIVISIILQLIATALLFVASGARTKEEKQKMKCYKLAVSILVIVIIMINIIAAAFGGKYCENIGIVKKEHAQESNNGIEVIGIITDD